MLPSKTEEIVKEIERYIISDGPFDNEEECMDYINRCIDATLIHRNDVFDVAKGYLVSDDILSLFVDRYIKDVINSLNISDFIKKKSSLS